MSLTLDITQSLGNFRLDVQFETKGGVTAVFGRSGSGKTSIVQAVAGLARPDRGRITLGERVLFDSDAGIWVPPHKRRIGYVFQDGRLFPHLSVAQNLAFGTRFASSNPEVKREAHIIDILGISHLLDRRPGGLSGGEKSRVALGRALLSSPELLLMDEPLAALDEPRKEEILPYLERLRDEGGAPVLYVSHSVAEVARLADDLVLLADGKVAASGPLADILSDPAAVPLLGVREAGSVLEATVAERSEDGLATLRISGGELCLPGVQAPVGARVRIRVLAQDIILSDRKPEGLSAINVLETTVQDIHLGDGPGAALSLLAGEDRLLARITARSVERLGLKRGGTCYAILKATAVPRGSISHSQG